jgi:hypothetical protein
MEAKLEFITRYSERIRVLKAVTLFQFLLCKSETISQGMSSRTAHPGYIIDRKQRGDGKDAQIDPRRL